MTLSTSKLLLLPKRNVSANTLQVCLLETAKRLKKEKEKAVSSWDCPPTMQM